MMQKWEYKVTRAHIGFDGDLKNTNAGLNIDARVPANSTSLDFTFQAMNAATAEKGDIPPLDQEEQDLPISIQLGNWLV